MKYEDNQRLASHISVRFIAAVLCVSGLGATALGAK